VIRCVASSITRKMVIVSTPIRCAGRIVSSMMMRVRTGVFAVLALLASTPILLPRMIAMGAGSPVTAVLRITMAMARVRTTACRDATVKKIAEGLTPVTKYARPSPAIALPYDLTAVQIRRPP